MHVYILQLCWIHNSEKNWIVYCTGVILTYMYKYTDNSIDAYTYLYPLVLFLFPFIGPCLWNIVFAWVFLLLRYTFGVLVVLFPPFGKKKKQTRKLHKQINIYWTKAVK